MHQERERGISIGREPGRTSLRRNFVSEAAETTRDLDLVWIAVVGVGVALGAPVFWAVRRLRHRGDLNDKFPTEFPKIKLPNLPWKTKK